MSFIPDKNLFIVTSSLKSNIGFFNDEERYTQTLQSLESLRKVVPEAIIVFSDVSVRPVSEQEKRIINQYCNFYFDLSEEPNSRYCAVNGLKSHGENCLMAATLNVLKNNPNVTPVLNDVKRIFKFSSRSILEQTFNDNEYDNLFGKFVFKKRVVSWSNPESHLLITRMFSFCPSLMTVYFQVLQQNLNCLSNNSAPDTEHSHFLNIPKEYLIEFDKLHCWGWLAGNGQIEHY